MTFIQVEQGRIRGKKEQCESGFTYYSFKGIPYAEPPIGNLRFMEPQKPKPWTGVRDAVEHGPVCTQIDFIVKTKKGEEDCLYMNVCTPTTRNTDNLPVMVWIHGGGFRSGSGSIGFFNPEYIIENKIIFVSFNYRLELFGFLCLDTPKAPGNIGLKDQVAALKWVKSNISAFGGNPDDITLLGESAGSMSISLHLLSPLSRGLFNRAIMQSGTAISSAEISKTARADAFYIGKLLGKDTDDADELFEFLRSVPSDELTGISDKIKHLNKDITKAVIIVPVVEKEGLTNTPFITKEPIEYLVKGEIADVPIIIGVNSAEALMAIEKNIDLKKKFDETPESFLAPEIRLTKGDKELEDIRAQIKNIYLKNADGPNDVLQAIMECFSDVQFIHPVYRFTNFVSDHNKSPIFMYYFDYESNDDLLAKKLQQKVGVKLKGAGHGSELRYIFKSKFDVIKKGTIDDNVKTNFVSMWTNFATKSNPTPRDVNNLMVWKPYKRSEKNYLIIKNDLKLEQDILKERMDLWDSLYRRIGSTYCKV